MNENTPAPIEPTTPQTEPVQTESQQYDSNPFTLAFNSFSLLTKYAKTVFYVALVLGGIGFVLNIGSELANISSETSTSSSIESSATTSTLEGTEIAAILTFVIAMLAVVMVIAIVINVVVKGTFAAGAIAATQKREISFGEAFSEMGQRFGTLFFASIQAGLRIIGGYLLFIVPGIRAQLRYEALPYIILENKELGASEAINESKRLYKDHLIESLGLTTVGGLIPVIGWVISGCGYAQSFQQIRAYKDANLPKPDVHILNWIIPLVIFGFIIMLLVLMGITFAALSS